MTPLPPHVLWEQAQRQLEFGQHLDAIDSLCQLLAQDPESADAHAMLAFVLVRERRLTVAEMEAGQAIHLEPASGYAHHAMGVVQLGKRNLTGAVEHLERAIALGGDGVWTRSALAETHLAMGDRARGDAVITEMLGTFAEVALAHALASDFYYACSRIGDAERHARIAISLDPGCAEAVAALGNVDLHNGNVEEARHAAIWLLQRNPSSDEALRLLALARYRKNPLFGAWFRYAVWTNQQDEAEAQRFLIGSWLLFALIRVTLRNLGLDELATALNSAWLGFCAFTWVMPMFADWAVSRELRKVVLQDDF